MKPSWNPLRCQGTALAPNLLLTAKLIAGALLVTNQAGLPFLPFVPGLESPPGAAFRLALQVVLAGSALALLFNRAVRASCLVLGLSILVAAVWSKASYGNNQLFGGCLLLLTGLPAPGRAPWLLRVSMAILYCGAGVHLSIDPEWHAGRWFDYWAGTRWPGMGLAKLFRWPAIVIELGVGVAFLFPRLDRVAIWGNLLFQSSLLFFTGTTFPMLSYATMAASLALARWPAGRAVVIWDGDCAFCALTKKWWERLDLERRLEWVRLQDPASARFGVAPRALEERLHLVTGDRIYSGFAAFKMMVLLNPVFYFATAGLLVLPARGYVAAGLLVVFFPWFSPVGEAAYNVVARNRRRLVEGSQCKV